MSRSLPNLTLLAVLASAALAAEQPPADAKPWPLWDGKETIAEYDKRVNLPPTDTLDLGGGLGISWSLTGQPVHYRTVFDWRREPGMRTRKQDCVMKAVEVDEDTSKESPVGTVSLGPKCRLKLVDAVVGKKTLLAKIVKDMNAKDRLHVETAATPGGPKFANASRIVDRDDAEFVVAMKEYLQKYHGIVLL